MTTAVLVRPRVICLPLAAALVRHGNLASAWLTQALGATLSSRDLPDELAEPVDLVEDHFAHLSHVLDHLEVEVESGGALGLVRGIVPDLKVGVFEGLLYADAGCGVEGKHLVEEVEGVGVGVGEERREGLLGHIRKVPYIFLGPRGSYPRESLLVGGTKDVEDLVELVDVVSTLEERTSTEKLGENAANRPHVNCGGGGLLVNRNENRVRGPSFWP